MKYVQKFELFLGGFSERDNITNKELINGIEQNGIEKSELKVDFYTKDIYLTIKNCAKLYLGEYDSITPDNYFKENSLKGYEVRLLPLENELLSKYYKYKNNFFKVNDKLAKSIMKNL